MHPAAPSMERPGQSQCPCLFYRCIFYFTTYSAYFNRECLTNFRFVQYAEKYMLGLAFIRLLNVQFSHLQKGNASTKHSLFIVDFRGYFTSKKSKSAYFPNPVRSWQHIPIIAPVNHPSPQASSDRNPAFTAVPALCMSASEYP